MKYIYLAAFVSIISLISSDCLSQDILIIQVTDERQPLKDVKVIIIGKTDLLPAYTDDDGKVYFDIQANGMGIGEEISIIATLRDYYMKEEPHRYIIMDPKFINFTKIVLYKHKCGFLSLNEFSKVRKGYTIGIGFGFEYRKGDHVTLGNIPSDIRIIPPHPDDVRNRFPEILPPDIPDNYLVRENTVRVDLGHRTSFDLGLNFFGVVNVAIRTSAIRESGIIYDQNLFRKNYIRPEFGGEAFIYYAIQSKSRQFFDGASFSLPIFVTYPVFYCGTKREIIFRIVGGTNILLPEKISLEAEQGWDRFGELEVMEKSDLGELKEVEWFGGIGIEGAPTKSIRLGIRFTLVYTDYQENFTVPLSLELTNEVHPSFRLNLTKLLGSK